MLLDFHKQRPSSRGKEGTEKTDKGRKGKANSWVNYWHFVRWFKRSIQSGGTL